MSKSISPQQGIRYFNEDGTATIEFVRLWDELVNGENENSIGKVVSGLTAVTAKADGIVAGTQPLTDIVIAGRGSITNELDANADQITDVNTGTGALTVKASPAYASGTRIGAGSVTTSSITFTVTNGTGPYTGVFSKVSGDTFAEVTSAFSGAALTTAFTRTIAANAFDDAQYKLTVTDTSDSSTASVNFSLSAYDEAGISA